MTDEQLGRAYCAAKGIAPVVRTYPFVLEYPDGSRRRIGREGSPPDYYLKVSTPPLFEPLVYEHAESEARAFAWLGADLREILAFADGVREVLK